MKDIVGQHGPLAVNVDATMWHDYLGMCCVCKHACVGVGGGEASFEVVLNNLRFPHIVWGSMQF